VRLRPVVRGRLETLTIWGVAAAVYIAIGVYFTDFMLSVLVAMAYLLLAVWIVPAAIRRFL
jgi:hypothetical protein